MLKSVLWIVFAFVLISVGCDSSGPEIVDEEQYAHSLLNGEFRDAIVTSAGRFPNNRIAINTYRYGGGQYAWGDALSLRFVYEPGRDAYPLNWRVTDEPPGRDGAFYAELSGPDAVIADYYGIDDEPNELRVTFYDPVTGLMEGEFEVTVVVDPGMLNNQMRQMPDTVRITDGRFRVVLWEIPE